MSIRIVLRFIFSVPCPSVCLQSPTCDLTTFIWIQWGVGNPRRGTRPPRSTNHLKKTLTNGSLYIFAQCSLQNFKTVIRNFEKVHSKISRQSSEILRKCTSKLPASRQKIRESSHQNSQPVIRKLEKVYFRKLETIWLFTSKQSPRIIELRV